MESCPNATMALCSAAVQRTRWATRSSARDVSVDHAPEHGHRHVAAGDDRVVEGAQIVARPERGPRRIAQAIDGAVADLVAAGLAWPGAIAVDLALHFVGIGAVFAHEEVDALRARPALRVNAGVDDQAAGAEGERLQIAEAANREIVIDAEFVGQLLGVKRPAFGIGIE